MGYVTEFASYWRSAAEDGAMQDAHGFVWKAMLDTIDADLAGKRVLDAGCNRGGFLCLLCDEYGIAEGRGYDPASAAIDDARRLAGRRPLRFEVADTVPAGWRSFDVAFSHEVLYVMHDLSAHAEAVFDALAPGSSYYAVIGVHAASPLMADWHRAHSDELQLPKLYTIGGSWCFWRRRVRGCRRAPQDRFRSGCERGADGRTIGTHQRPRGDFAGCLSTRSPPVARVLQRQEAPYAMQTAVA
jgi:SAM-dependent methyltransferase